MILYDRCLFTNNQENNTPLATEYPEFYTNLLPKKVQIERAVFILPHLHANMYMKKSNVAVCVISLSGNSHDTHAVEWTTSIQTCCGRRVLPSR
jgi:hypothetical protein